MAVCRFVPPTTSFAAVATPTPRASLQWVLTFGVPLAGGTLDWFVLPPTSSRALQYNASVHPSAATVLRSGASEVWFLSVNITSGFVPQSVAAKPVWLPSETLIQYQPPVPQLAWHGGDAARGVLATITVNFSAPVSGLAADHFVVTSGDMLLTVVHLVAKSSGGCSSAGCDPGLGSRLWEVQLRIDRQYQDASVVVKLPAGLDAVMPKNAGATVTAWVDAVDVDVTADVALTATTAIFFTVTFNSPVSGLTSDDLTLEAGATAARATIVDSRRLRLRAGTGDQLHGHRLQSAYRVLVELTGNYTPGDVALGVKERSVQPPNAAYPIRARDGTPKDSQVTVRCACCPGQLP